MSLSYEFSGDKQAALLLRSEGLQFYNFVVRFAELSGIGFITRTKSYNNGSIITVTSMKNMGNNQRMGKIYIQTRSKSGETYNSFSYLDSGIIDISLGKLDINYYKPAMLYHTQETLADLVNPNRLNGVLGLKSTTGAAQAIFNRPAITPNVLLPNQIQVYSSGVYEGERTISYGDPYVNRSDKSLPLADEEKMLLPPGSVTDFVGVAGDFNVSNFFTKKYITQTFPGSMFTGKAKAYVQGLYGSNFNKEFQFRISENKIIGFYVPTKIEPYSHSLALLPYDEGYNICFVPRVGGYSILLMVFTSDSYTIWELKPEGSVAKKLLKEYNPNLPRLELTQVVTIILSSCYVTDKVSDTTLIQGGTPSTAGRIPAYSWKFNFRGDEGVAVFYQHSSDLTRDSDVLTTKITLSINLSYVDGVLNHTVIANFGRTGVISTYTTPILFPAAQNVALEWYGIYPPSLTLVGSPYNNTDSADIYAYYDNNDNMVNTISTQNISTSSDSSRSFTESVGTIVGATAGVVYSSEEYWKVPGQIGNSSVSVGSTIYSTSSTPSKNNARIVVGTLDGTTSILHNQLYLDAPRLIDYNLYDAGGGLYRYIDNSDGFGWYGNYGIREFTITNETGTTSIIETVVVCIPTRDASSVLVYKASTTTRAANNVEVVGTPLGGDGDGPSTSGEFRSVFTATKIPNAVAQAGGNLWFWNANYNRVPLVNNTVQYNLNTSVNYHGADVTTNGVLLAQVADIPTLMETLQHPWLATEPIPPLYSQQSLQTAWKVYYGIDTGTFNSNFAHDSAVGWA